MALNSLSIDDTENFKILVATDLHLGFEEKNLIRGKKKLHYIILFIRIIFSHFKIVII